MRISMHPDQFTLINSLKGGIFKRSVRELLYHARILDLMGLGMDARIQIHVGGVYGDKNAGIARFIERYTKLPEEVKRRLAIENDDISYTLADCLRISDAVGIPVIFDVFHHELNSSGESIARALEKAAVTWKKRDGILMVDYSSQKRNARKGSHSESIDMKQFSAFLKKSRGIDFDLMLEIKDKEKSAVKAVKAAENDPRLIAPRQKGNSPLLVTT